MSISAATVRYHTILTSRRTVESDDFGGASAGGISIRGSNDTAGHDLIATLMEGVVTMAAHMSDIGQGRAHEGGRGGQNSTPHDENVMVLILCFLDQITERMNAR